ncbi:MAG: O-antigen ligase family protein, partial [Oscillospiraceae bacterium]|nr:O-antigen ligase family protein [Oscillospiraceae bacterium]
MKKIISFLNNNFLFLLLAAQPVLDAIAYWLQSDDGTIAGKIRLAIMVIVPVVLLFRLEKKKSFIISMAVMGIYSVLHILNGFRVGYIDLYYDVAYLVRVLYMPVMAICLVHLVNSENRKQQLVKGVITAAALSLAFLAIAIITGTDNVTYAEGMGISGWVIDDNRCANSIILVSLTCFAVFFGIKSDKTYVNVLVPFLCQVVLIMNGTKACYLGLMCILLGYMVFLLLEKPILKKKIKKTAVIALGVLLVLSVVIYPITPRAKAAADRATVPNAKWGEIEAAAGALGYDITKMTPEERFNNSEVKAVFAHYYPTYMGAIPDLFDRFGMDAVLLHFNMSTDVARLIDTREIKLCYSALIWDQCDFLTKLVGFEVTEIGTEGFRDLENDW